MIADLKPYPAMKETGVPWLGEVPEHWKLLPNRALMRRRKVLVGDRHTEYRLLSLTKEGVIVRDVESGKGKFSADMGTSQEVRNGDLIFCLFDIPETPRTVGLSRHDGMITGAYTVFECPDPMLSAFLDLFYRAMDDRKLLSPLYSGLRNTIPPTRFLSTTTPVPSPGEQAAIVRFLNHTDWQIQRYIGAKQKLIKLLEEQKQAVIRRAVTRGLDPNIRTKPSGVEWLGDMPEHWEVRRGKFVFASVDVRSSTGSEELLTVSSRDGVVPRAGRDITMFMAASYSGYKLCWPEDLVINSLWAWANGLGFSAYHGIVSTAYGVYRLREPHRQLWRYLHFALRSGAYDWQFQVRSKGIWKSRLQLTDWSFLDMPIILPPAEEASAICTRIETETVELTKAIEIADREVSFLREYRKRLIADVATGKLDVREAAKRLPGQPPGVESLDTEDAFPDGEAAGAFDEMEDVAEEAFA